MVLYPLNLKTENKLCVVVGSGNVAHRKVASLLEAGGRVRVISPEFQPEIWNLKSGNKIEIIERSYEKGDLAGAFLVIAATDDEVVNQQVATDAKEAGILVNVVDRPQLCDFFTPSIVRRGDLVISISTSGKFPALSKKLRKELEQEFGSEYEPYLSILNEARNKVISKYADLNIRKDRLQELANLPVVDLIKRGKIKQAKEQIERVI